MSKEIEFQSDYRKGTFTANIPQNLFMQAPQDIYFAVVDIISKQFVEKHGKEILKGISLDDMKKSIEKQVGNELSKKIVEFVAVKLK